jgi:hypothetical protein
MNAITPSTTKPVRMCVLLGRVHARRLESDTRTADLAPAISAATDRLDQTFQAREAAVGAWKVAGLAKADRLEALNLQVQVASLRARMAAAVAGTPETTRDLFPKAVSRIRGECEAGHVSSLHTVVERLAVTDAETSKALAAALAAYEEVHAAYMEARRKAHSATVDQREARRAWHQAYRMSFHLVASRVGTTKTAVSFFQPVGPHASPQAAPVAAGTAAVASAAPPGEAPPRMEPHAA